jgi:hypothetical protein
MTVITEWSIEIPIEEIFQTQQTDTRMIQQRRPQLFELTSRAVRDAQAVLRPVVIYERCRVVRQESTRLVLENDFQLTGGFVAKRFTYAEEIVAVVCSIGKVVEKLVSRAMTEGKSAYGYALDTAGCVALSQLVSQVYWLFESEALKGGKKISSRYGPGIHSWPVQIGQPQLFAILPECYPYVQLTPSMQMLPIKSTSFVVGIGENITRQGNECEDCDAHNKCSYRISYLADSQPASV